MPLLKPQYLSEAEIPQEQKEWYKPVETEDQGTVFRLQVDGGEDGWKVENVTGLLSTKGRQKEQIDTLKKTTEAKDQEIATLKTENQRLAASAPEQAQAFQLEIGTLKSQLGEKEREILTGAEERNLREAAVAEGLPPKFAVPEMQRHVRTRRNEAGTIITEAVDAEGNPRTSFSSTAKQMVPVTLKVLASEVGQQEDFKKLREGYSPPRDTPPQPGSQQTPDRQDQLPTGTDRWGQSFNDDLDSGMKAQVPSTV